MIGKRNDGFSIVTSVLVIAVIAAASYLLWSFFRPHTNNSEAYTRPGSSTVDNRTTTTNLPTGTVDTSLKTKAYTYPGNYFSISYPLSWTLNTRSIYSGNHHLPDRVYIIPPNSPKLYAGGVDEVSITVYKSNNLENVVSQYATTTSPAISKSLNINGYSALFEQYTHSPNGETHIDDNYAITNGKITVEFYFRVTESAMPAGSGFPAIPAINQTKLLPQFNAIVASIRFN